MQNIMCLDKDGNSINHLTQWDYNQKLIIDTTGLNVSDLYQIQFCNQKSTEAFCVKASFNTDGNIEAAIPNQLLMEPYPIHAYIWIADTDSGKTQYAITIPVRKRIKPHDFEFVENIEIVEITELQSDIAAVSNRLTELEKELNAELNNKVDKTQYASTSQYGIIKISSTGAIISSSGVLSVNTNTAYGTQKINNTIAAQTVAETHAVNTGAAAQTFTFAVNLNVTANTTYTAKVTDAEGKTTTANTGAFTFVYPYYAGVIAATAQPDAAAIKALSKKVETKGTKTISYTAANQKMVFASPASYGEIKTITDPNGFNVTSTFTKSTVSITGADGTSQSYYVYTSDPTTVTEFSMKFAY